MKLAELIELRDIFERMAAHQDAVLSETEVICRVDQLPSLSRNDFDTIRRIASELARSGHGELEVYGDISGRINLDTHVNSDLTGEAVSMRLVKNVEPNTTYLLTPSGFDFVLNNGQVINSVRQVWVASEFQPFVTQRCCYSPWGTEAPPTPSDETFDSPNRLVRDQTHQLAPRDLAPWYLLTVPGENSPVFELWKAHAAKNLAFALPTEVRPNGDGIQVVLKGARSAFAEVDQNEMSSGQFELLRDAARWVYDQKRDTETKFHLLNNHLALYWIDGRKWPQGLSDVLENALASAREAFAFHLQEDSKEAIKSLGDLRKALQDEVHRAQISTRDFLSALWRDAAVAVAVFALRAASSASSININLIAVCAAILLFASLLTTVLSNWRFDILARNVRDQWRNRLYAFMSDDQWKELVSQPISRARLVYRLSIIPVLIVYATLIGALLWVPYPDQIETFLQVVMNLPTTASQHVKEFWGLFSAPNNVIIPE